jgi:hypothetical protein
MATISLALSLPVWSQVAIIGVPSNAAPVKIHAVYAAPSCPGPPYNQVNDFDLTGAGTNNLPNPHITLLRLSDHTWQATSGSFSDTSSGAQNTIITIASQEALTTAGILTIDQQITSVPQVWSTDTVHIVFDVNTGQLLSSVNFAQGTPYQCGFNGPIFTDRSVTTTATGTLPITFTCALPNRSYNVTPFYQNLQDNANRDPEPWASDRYDGYTDLECLARIKNNSSCQIHSLGCNLTATAMALKFANISVDPGSLNTFMNNHRGDYSGHDVDIAYTVADVQHDAILNPQRAPLLFMGQKSSSAIVLAQLLESGPVITGVNNNKHFVLVTGRTCNNNGTFSFSIVDPGRIDNKVLTGSFETRGVIVDPADQSLLTLSAGDNVSILLTDQYGNRAGYESVSGSEVSEIPSAFYTHDYLSDNDTGEVIEGDIFLDIRQPSDGPYTIVVNGQKAGAFTLAIGGFSKDGESNPVTLLNGQAVPGSSATFSVQYSSMTGSAVAAQIVGDINGDGKVDCSDTSIVRAAFNTSATQPRFDPRADVNFDGIVNIRDLSLVSQHLPTGTSCPAN